MLYVSVAHLEKFLDPAYTDQLTLSSEAKMEIILAGEFCTKYDDNIGNSKFKLIHRKLVD